VVVQTIVRSKILRKRRGVFFTPSTVADLLASWAIRSRDDSVLEPSFGGCSFLRAIERRLSSLGNDRAWPNIYGCDVASRAFSHYLASLPREGEETTNFLQADFLALKPHCFGLSGFNTALGNPPYVSYHNMFKNQRATAHRVAKAAGFSVSGLSSLWAYFVIHSVQFLLPRGRMAWLLPGSAVHADYAKDLLRQLGQRFRRVALISLRERLFLGAATSEKTEVLLCDDLGTVGTGDVEIADASDLSHCGRLLGEWEAASWRGTPLNGRVATALVPAGRLKAFESI
jgi:adenine-specific DNA-methyltransferase